MRILIINHYAGSDNMGMVFRTYYFAKEWVRMGHQVYIVAGSYSHLRQQNPVVEKDLQEDIIDGIHYIWLITDQYQENGAKRAVSMFRFTSKLMKYRKKIAETVKPDTVIATSVYHFDALPAYKIAKACKITYWHEVRDMWPITLMELGGMKKNHPFVMAVQMAENYAYKHADGVIALLKYAKEYMCLHGLKEEKFYYVPNGILKEEWEESNIEHLDDRIVRRIRKNDSFVVGFFGSVNATYGLNELLDAAKTLSNEGIRFVIVGEGRSKADLQHRAETENIKNIEFIEKIPKKQIPDLLRYFDCAYIGSQKNSLFRFGINMNKMYDAMMGARPLVFAVDTPPTPVSESGCGIVIPPGEPQRIVEAVRQLKSMKPEEREAMGEAGKKEVLGKYTYSELAVQYLDIIRGK